MYNKEEVHLKIKIMSLIYSLTSCYKPVWVSFFWWITKVDILKNVGNQKLMVAIDFCCVSFFFYVYASQWLLATYWWQYMYNLNAL